MNAYTVSHLESRVLLLELKTLVAQDRTTTASLLARIAEVRRRRLYAGEGYSSMYAYCIGALRMSEEVAYKRIRAARAATRFPSILERIANGRLNLGAVALLATYLTQANGTELLAAAEGKTNVQIRELLAERFPQPDLPTLLLAVESHPAAGKNSVEAGHPMTQPSVRTVEPRLSAPLASPIDGSPARVAPLAPCRYGVQFTIGQEDRELLERAKELLSHQFPTADAADVFVQALRAFVPHLEKRKFAATEKPHRGAGRESANPRHLPAAVQRAVWQRDRGQCTFVGNHGQRCEERKFLEFDHVLGIGRGGRSSVGNLRLRCRTHNRYTAEQTYGEALIRGRIERARESRKHTVAAAAV